MGFDHPYHARVPIRWLHVKTSGEAGFLALCANLSGLHHDKLKIVTITYLFIDVWTDDHTYFNP